MKKLLAGLAVAIAIASVPQFLLAKNETKVGCRFYMDEVISLTEDRKGQVDMVISTNRTLMDETAKHMKSIDGYISSSRIIVRRSQEPEVARTALRFAETTKKTKAVTAELLRAVNNILKGVSDGLRSHMEILALVRDKECPQ